MCSFPPVLPKAPAKCGGFQPKMAAWPKFARKSPNSGLTFDTFAVKIDPTIGAQMCLAEQSRNAG